VDTTLNQEYATYLFLLIIGIFVLFLLIPIVRIPFSGILVVDGHELAILEKRFFGQQLPPGRFIAVGNGIGVQAGVKGPGMYFFTPFLYRIKKSPFTNIPEGKIGIVESTDGNPVAQGRIFAKAISTHNMFQDGEKFLADGGEKGIQISIIPPGIYQINPELFVVTIRDNVYIPPGQLGIITATDGLPLSSGRLLADHVKDHKHFENAQAFISNGGQRGPQLDVLLPGTYRLNTELFKLELKTATVVPVGKVGIVTALDGAPLPADEYVAEKIDGHMDFQDASQFLLAGGQRGPQLDLLRPGTYYINPLMFEVTLQDIVEVKRGHVSVLVSNYGKSPLEAPIQSSAELKTSVQEQYVVPKGYRGIQKEVLGPGRYYLNLRASMAYIVSTTNIIIAWAAQDQNPKYNPLMVISKDGFAIEIAMKVVIRVRPDQAPYMVAKIGSIDNLIQNVIQPTVASSLRNQASETSAMSFMLHRQEEQKKVDQRARGELEKYHVECVSVLICQINLPQELMDTQTQRIIAAEQMEMFITEGNAEDQRAIMEKKKAQANIQPKLVEAEIDTQIATQSKLKTVTAAEAEGESKRIIAEAEAAGIQAHGEADAARILAIGKATASAYELQSHALGDNQIAAIEIAKQIAEGEVKITPDFLVQGGENSHTSLLSAYLSKLIHSHEA